MLRAFALVLMMLISNKTVAADFIGCKIFYTGAEPGSWEVLSRDKWTSPALINQHVKIVSINVLGIRKVFEGLVEQQARETFDERQESNGFSPIVLKGEGTPIPLKGISEISVLVRNAVEGNNLPERAENWPEVKRANWISTELIDVPVGIFFKDSLGFFRFTTSPIKTVPKITYDARGEENSPTPFILKDGTSIRLSEIKEIRIQNSETIPQIPAQFKGWIKADQTIWQSRSLIDRVVTIKVTLNIGLSKWVTGTLKAVPEKSWDSRGEANVPGPFVFADGQRVSFDSVDKLLLLPTRAELNANDLKKYQNWTSIDLRHKRSPELIGNHAAIIFINELGNREAVEGKINAVPKTTYDSRGEENAPTPFVVEGHEKPIQDKNILEIRISQ